MIDENLAVPFETTVLGVPVTVERLDLNHSVAVCTRGSNRQSLPILPLIPRIGALSRTRPSEIRGAPVTPPADPRRLTSARTSRAGIAPVCSPRSKIGVPATGGLLGSAIVKQTLIRIKVHGRRAWCMKSSRWGWECSFPPSRGRRRTALTPACPCACGR
jgi:hypothetical protein